MAKVCKPFTMANFRYFDATESDAAKKWSPKSRFSRRFDAVPVPAKPKLSLRLPFRLVRRKD